MKSESSKKLEDVDRLRAAEKFMTVGTGEAECIQCGYLYKPKDGDPEYPVAPKTQFQVSAHEGRGGGAYCSYLVSHDWRFKFSVYLWLITRRS